MPHKQQRPWLNSVIMVCLLRHSPCRLHFPLHQSQQEGFLFRSQFQRECWMNCDLPSSDIINAAFAIALSFSSSISFPWTTVAVASPSPTPVWEVLTPWISFIWFCNLLASVTNREVRLSKSDACWNLCKRFTRICKVSYGTLTLTRSLEEYLSCVKSKWEFQTCLSTDCSRSLNPPRTDTSAPESALALDACVRRASWLAVTSKTSPT